MPWYGAESFVVEAVKIYHGIPAKFQLTITPSWVLIVDIESNRILHVLDWTKLRNYGGKLHLPIASTALLHICCDTFARQRNRQREIFEIQNSG